MTYCSNFLYDYYMLEWILAIAQSCKLQIQVQGCKFDFNIARDQASPKPPTPINKHCPPTGGRDTTLNVHPQIKPLFKSSD